jgi:uncharacterized protein (TIGR03118 family)
LAVTVPPNGADHAVYKGLALGAVDGAQYLYATDLHNNKINVFDTNFSKPAAMQGKFIDPGMPTGFVPFGITPVNGQLFVTYAMQDSAKHDEVTGAGLGYVDIFDFSGNFIFCNECTVTPNRAVLRQLQDVRPRGGMGGGSDPLAQDSQWAPQRVTRSQARQRLIL